MGALFDNALLKCLNINKCKFRQQFFEQLVCSIIGNASLRLENVLQFMTGSPSIPPLRFDKNITMKFKHCIDNKCQCRPAASTCALDLTLPVHFSSSEDFTS